jgi:hypothetical protein
MQSIIDNPDNPEVGQKVIDRQEKIADRFMSMKEYKKNKGKSNVKQDSHFNNMPRIDSKMCKKGRKFRYLF